MGSRLASGGKEKTVKVWDAASGQQVASCKGHTGEIRSVAFSPDGLRLASAGGIFDPKGVVGPDITMWNAATGNEVFSTPGHKGGVSGVAFSPDGKTLASSGSPWDPVTRKTGGEVGLWDAASGKEIRTIHDASAAIHCLAWSPDGKQLATGWGDGTLKVWDPVSGKLVLSLRHGRRRPLGGLQP